jgi:Homeodomain-like domain
VERLILRLIHLWRRVAMKKEYVVELTKEEREYLHKLISSGSAPARKLNRARILLKTDIGNHAEAQALSDRQIAQMLDTSIATVQRARERFYEGGLEAALERSKPEIGSTSALWRDVPKLILSR